MSHLLLQGSGTWFSCNPSPHIQELVLVPDKQDSPISLPPDFLLAASPFLRNLLQQQPCLCQPVVLLLPDTRREDLLTYMEVISRGVTNSIFGMTATNSKLRNVNKIFEMFGMNIDVNFDMADRDYGEITFMIQEEVIQDYKDNSGMKHIENKEQGLRKVKHDGCIIKTKKEQRQSKEKIGRKKSDMKKHRVRTRSQATLLAAYDSEMSVDIVKEVSCTFSPRELESLEIRLIKEDPEHLPCGFCDRKCSSAVGFTAHSQSRHSKSRYFSNKICPVENCRFSGSKVIDHIRAVHTREAVFFCSLCGMGFSTLSNKQRHKKKHDNPILSFCKKCCMFYRKDRGCKICSKVLGNCL